MSTFITDTDAITRFTGTWSATDLAGDVAASLSCEEVDALAGLLRALGEPAAADCWIDMHAEGDDEGDRHHTGMAMPYIVPVDPMDALQCDSCQ